MKIYEITIKPKSAFLTELKGDMIFGSLCWQIEKLGLNLSEYINDYKTNPFLVVSSAFYKKDGKYFFNKPSAPNHLLFDNIDVKTRKENDKKKFFSYSKGDSILAKKLNYAAQSFIIYKDITHVTINRLTGTTGEGEFAPYSINAFYYSNEAELVIFAAIDENRFSKENLKDIFINLGKSGFGKRASIGYGQFDFAGIDESNLFNENLDGDYLYSLSPFVLSKNENENLEDIYFQPFTRYGKHGDELAKSENPFKKPVIMADNASLVSFKNKSDKTYPIIIGSAITDISDALPATVIQGYSLCFPIILKERQNV